MRLLFNKEERSLASSKVNERISLISFVDLYINRSLRMSNKEEQSLLTSIPPVTNSSSLDNIDEMFPLITSLRSSTLCLEEVSPNTERISFSLTLPSP